MVEEGNYKTYFLFVPCNSFNFWGESKKVNSRLRGEKDICQLIERTEKYVESKDKLNLFDSDEICKVYMMRIEHLYYKVETNDKLKKRMR